MKKSELIALGLDEEMAKKVEAASVEELKTYVPYERFKETIDERNGLRDSLKERDGQLETLRKSGGDVEEMKKTIETLQAENKSKDEAHAAEIKTLKIENAVTAALTAAKAKNPKVARAMLDLEKAELADDGTVKGLDDQIKAALKSDPYLFDTQTKKPSIKGAVPAETGMEEPDTNVDISKMTYEEMAAYMEANPDAQI